MSPAGDASGQAAPGADERRTTLQRVDAPAAGPLPATAARAGGSPRLPPLFGIVGLLLLATLLAAAFVQARQYSLLNMTVQYQDDYAVLSLYQLEIEYLRLRETLAGAGESPDETAIKLRYDIFLSRVALLDNDRAWRLLDDTAAATEALRDIRGFARRADLYLGDEPRGHLSAQAVLALLAELRTLDAPIRHMMLDATHRVAARVTERQMQVRQHNRIGLALTGCLLAILVLFAVIALRQLRLLDRRRREQELLADQLREARVEAEAASLAKSAFLADMSHELRTPLNGLMGMLSLARSAPRDPRSGDWLAVADESASHLLRLLDDILDLSKLEAGTLALVPQPVHLATLLREVQALLQPLATAKSLGLQAELDPSLPAWVSLDPTRVRQVLFNLLANAVKFSDCGAILLRCRQRAGAEPSDPAQLDFDVADTGIGMDPETLSRLFRRFSRADDPRARHQGGAGLGLAISRNLASLMGGELVVHSTPGEGSVFSFRCPLEPAAAPELPTAPVAGAAARTLQVLVAEDHPVNRQYMAALFERLGHPVAMVDNGRDAVHAVAAQGFDLVLMDVHMPVLDGAAAIAEIRALPGAAGRTCIVALTADVFADTRERCLRAGATEVMTKPVSLAALQSLLARRFGAGDEPPSPAADGAGDASALLDPAKIDGVREVMGANRLPALYGGFFEQADAAARRMREAMRDADTEALRRSAHSVKGAASNLGLPALADAAAALNRDAGTLAAAPLALAVQRFEAVAAATRALCVGQGLLS